MRVLVVEDEPAVARHLTESLRDMFDEVVPVERLEALDTLLNTEGADFPAVIILDRLLYGIDSAARISKIRTKWPNSKVLVLSAVGGPVEKGRILDAGADDYVSKPFSMEELSSRIRVLLRRPQNVSNPILALGNLVLNPLNQSVEVQKEKLELSRREFQLLSLLLNHPARVFSRIQLLDQIWDVQNYVESNVVEATVKNLRKKLESSKSNVKILSKRFMGYWIEA